MRNYKRKHASQWRDKDKRMTLAAQMHGQGMSLRQIAAELAVSYQTVANDLARWRRERPNVVHLSKTPVKSYPLAGQHLTPEFDSESAVVELRRRA